MITELEEGELAEEGVALWGLIASHIPYTREHNDRSFYLKLVAAMGRYIYGVYLFMG